MKTLALALISIGLEALKAILQANSKAGLKKYKKACDLVLEIADIIRAAK